MKIEELFDIINSGETSKVQFKKELSQSDSVASEMIAMANSKGGMIIFGIEDKTGKISGLSYAELQSYGSRLADIANNKIKPQIFITTETLSVLVDNEIKKVLTVTVSEGISKPYKDNEGIIWIKQGPDKRKLTDNNEQIRLFQQSGLLFADEMIIPGSGKNDIEVSKIKEYIEKIPMPDFEEDIEINETLLTNLNVMKDSRLTLGGLLFFSKDPQKFRPVFCIKAISFFGNEIGGMNYRSSQDITGTIPRMFDEGVRFFTSNLLHLQAGQNFNSVGKLEISQIALEELLQNALVHRDYTKNAPVRIMIFDNRIEIVSPGTLPNSLTVENIKMGNATARNNLIVSYGSKLMKYRGFGSGIPRALAHQPDMQLINDVEGELFKVTIPRPIKK